MDFKHLDLIVTGRLYITGGNTAQLHVKHSTINGGHIRVSSRTGIGQLDVKGTTITAKSLKLKAYLTSVKHSPLTTTDDDYAMVIVSRGLLDLKSSMLDAKGDIKIRSRGIGSSMMIKNCHFDADEVKIETAGVVTIKNCEVYAGELEIEGKGDVLVELKKNKLKGFEFSGSEANKDDDDDDDDDGGALMGAILVKNNDFKYEFEIERAFSVNAKKNTFGDDVEIEDVANVEMKKNVAGDEFEIEDVTNANLKLNDLTGADVEIDADNINLKLNNFTSASVDIDGTCTGQNNVPIGDPCP